MTATPTRHGDVRALVQRPRERAGPTDPRPVVVHLHGAGFVNRNPAQDLHIARHLAAHLGAVVVLPDDDTAPRVRYPVAEEAAVDIVRWTARCVPPGAGTVTGWPCPATAPEPSSPSPPVSRCTPRASRSRALSRWSSRSPTPSAPTAPPRSRGRRSARGCSASWHGPTTPTSPGARRHWPLRAWTGVLSRALPPKLVLTGEHDTLAPEGAELAQVLRAGGVQVEHHQYPEPTTTSSPPGRSRPSVMRCSGSEASCDRT